MTDQHRNSLRVAQAFAKAFINSADHEIKGGDPSWREEAAMHLAQALRNIEPPVYNPDINKPSTEPYPEVPYGPTGKHVCFDGIPSHPLIPASGTEDFDDF